MEVVYVSGSRADYSPMRGVLRRLAGARGIHLGLILTGMHLATDEAATARQVRGDGLRVIAVAGSLAHQDSGVAMARAFGATVASLATALARARPDVVMLQGDRDEALAAAIAAAHIGIPIVHLGGGERSGSIDDADRDAISRFSALHLTGSAPAARRLAAMGFDRKTIRVVGEPGLDDLIRRRRLRRRDLVLLVQHPVVGRSTGVRDLRETIAALDSVGLPVIATYPNTDAGGRAMRAELIRAARARSSWSVLPNAPSREEWLDLLLTARVMVGNSSSAIIEAPAAGLPVVNVGDRQKGRLRARNVVDAPHERGAVEDAVRRQLAVARRRRGRPYAGPYGAGDAAGKIVAAIRAWWRARPR